MICNSVVNHILEYIKGESYCEELFGYPALITPFLFTDGDNITLIIKQFNGYQQITDAGETSRRLMEYGFNFNAKLNKERIESILISNNVKFQQGELFINLSEPVTSGEKIMDLIHTIQQFDTLQYTVTIKDVPNFTAKVHAYLETEGFSIQSKQIIKGDSGTPWNVDMLVNHNQYTCIMGLYSPSSTGMKIQVNRLGMAYLDIRNTINKFTYAAIVDDFNANITDEEERLIKPYLNIDIGKWSEKEKFANDLRQLKTVLL